MLLADGLHVSVRGCITPNQSKARWDRASRGRAAQLPAFYRMYRLSEIAPKHETTENFVFKKQQRAIRMHNGASEAGLTLQLRLFNRQHITTTKKYIKKMEPLPG